MECSIISNIRSRNSNIDPATITITKVSSTPSSLPPSTEPIIKRLSKKEIKRYQKSVLLCFHPDCRKPAPQRRCDCKNAYYCDSICQKNHWDIHKQFCTEITPLDQNSSEHDRLYKNWRFPRHKKLCLLAQLLFSSSTCNTHFIIIPLTSIDDELIMDPISFTYVSINQSNDDSNIFLPFHKDSLVTMRNTVTQFRREFQIPTGLKGTVFQHALIFFLVVIPGESVNYHLQFWPCNVQCVNQGSRSDINRVVKSINSTPKYYIPSDADSNINSYPL